MAFQRGGFKKQEGGNSPAWSIKFSVKHGKGYTPIEASIGLWPNDQGGPAFRGTLKDDRLAGIVEGLSYALENGAQVSVSLFDNSEREQRSSGFGAKKFGFGKQVGGLSKFPANINKKPNPFKARNEQGEETGEPNFGEE